MKGACLFAHGSTMRVETSATLTRKGRENMTEHYRIYQTPEQRRRTKMIAWLCVFSAYGGLAFILANLIVK